jgi:hypothetical protein
MNLFKVATQTSHDYYHILSGADLPIKSANEIDSFFYRNYGKEFIGFSKKIKLESVQQRNYLLGYRGKCRLYGLLRNRIRKQLINMQKMVEIDITKKYKGEIKKGPDWYSVTHKAAIYLIDKEPEFRKVFCRAFCPSEFFAQTVLYNSPFKNNIYNIDDEYIGCQRLIDWERGRPYVFKKEDFELLKSSELLFARKFMSGIDSEIIDKVYDYIKKK